MQDVDQEANIEEKDNHLKNIKNWPGKGEIRFDNVGLRYQKSGPLVLRNVDIEMAPGSKIGVVGRTGAGKSSLITVLLRLSELDEGKITIDGVDISKISLFDLRSAIAVIPQDPVLFQGIENDRYSFCILCNENPMLCLFI